MGFKGGGGGPGPPRGPPALRRPSRPPPPPRGAPSATRVGRGRGPPPPPPRGVPPLRVPGAAGRLLLLLEHRSPRPPPPAGSRPSPGGPPAAPRTPRACAAAACGNQIFTPRHPLVVAAIAVGSAAWRPAHLTHWLISVRYGRRLLPGSSPHAFPRPPEKPAATADAGPVEARPKGPATGRATASRRRATDLRAGEHPRCRRRPAAPKRKPRERHHHAGAGPIHAAPAPAPAPADAAFSAFMHEMGAAGPGRDRALISLAWSQFGSDAILRTDAFEAAPVGLFRRGPTAEEQDTVAAASAPRQRATTKAPVTWEPSSS